MGKLIDQYDNVSGWVTGEKRCKACETEWVEVYHIFMSPKVLRECPFCLRKKAVLNNVIPFRNKITPQQEPQG